MATGINDDKLNAFKVELLNYTESINLLKEDLDGYKTTLKSNLKGSGQEEIIGKLNSILGQFPTVNKNINNYISTVGKVIKAYENQDDSLNSQISKNITKLEGMKEEK